MLTVESRETDAAGAGQSEDHQPIRLLDGFEDAAVLQLDLDGRVQTWNGGAERTLGWSAAGGPSARDRRLPFTAAEIAAGRPQRALRAALRNGRCQIAGWRVRADGSRFWAQILIRPRFDHGQRAVGFVALVHDLTSYQRRVHRLRTGIELSHAILRGIRFEQVVRLVARRARALIQSDGAQVTVREPGTDGGPVSVAVGWNARLLGGSNGPADRSLADLVTESGCSQIVNDASWAVSFRSSQAGAASLGPALGVPLGPERARVGVLAVYNRVGGPAFRPQDLADLCLFASEAAPAMHLCRGSNDWGRLVAEERARLWHVFQCGAIQSLDHIARGLADAASDAASRCDKASHEQLTSCAGTVEGVIQDVRNHVLALRPSILEGRRLDDALRLLARDVELRSGVATYVDMEAEAAERLTARAADVVQLVREALSNAERHAHARCCRLRLRAEKGKALLDIEDDGVGFELGRVRDHGHGLSSLRERVARMGGRLQIESAPHAGTALRIAIPV